MQKETKAIKNYIIKIFCIILSLILWIFVMYDMDPVDKRVISQVPVKIRNLDNLENLNLALSVDQNLATDVQLIGKRSIISSISKNSIDLFTEIKNPKLGANKVIVEIPEQNQDLEIKLNPYNIDVKLEKLVSKCMPVTVKMLGGISENSKLDSVTINPKEVYIKGPASQVAKVDKVLLYVNVEGVKESFSKWQDIKIVDAESKIVQGVTVTETSAIVNVNIEKNISIPVELSFSEEGYELPAGYEFNPNKINIAGESSIINGIQSIKTEQIDVNKLENQASTRVKLIIPPEIKASQDEIEIINTNSENKIFIMSYLNEDVKIISNQDPNLDEILRENLTIPKYIKIEVEYKKNDDLRYEDERNYSIVIDLNKYNSESGIVPIEVNTELNVLKMEIEPDVVFIKIPSETEEIVQNTEENNIVNNQENTQENTQDNQEIQNP